MTWSSMLMATAVASADPTLSAGHRDTLEVTDADAAAIRTAVRRQLGALRRGDAATAYALCSPSVREQVEDADAFLEAVVDTYPALAAARQLVFGTFHITPDGLGVVAQLVDTDGVHHAGYFLVVRDAEADEGWSVDGCMLQAVGPLREAA